MSDITAEKRLELIRNIREENNRNRSKLRNRESILYGQNYDDSVTRDTVEVTETSTRPASSLGIRIVIAIVLFSIFIIFEYTEKTFFSINSTIIYKYLQENYTWESFDFIEDITYNLNNVKK